VHFTQADCRQCPLLGQKRTLRYVRFMSALPAKADIRQRAVLSAKGKSGHWPAGDLELGKFARLRIDLACAAILLDDDVAPDPEPKPIDFISLVKATSCSLLHLESVDGHFGIVRVRTRFDGWRRNFARRCTSTGVGGGIYLRGRYSFGRSLRG